MQAEVEAPSVESRTGGGVVASKATPDLLESDKRPLVTYSEGVDKAWAAKVAGETAWP